MPTIFKRPVLTREGEHARQYLLSNWDEIEAAANDPIAETLEAMAPFVDDGWDGLSTYSPSELMRFRYFIGASDMERPDRVHRAKEDAAQWISEARTRYKSGYFANPFGPPVLRKGPTP
jgi:hypothetical protein